MAKVAVPHRFFAQFPIQINRETISKNRDFFAGTGTVIDQIASEHLSTLRITASLFRITKLTPHSSLCKQTSDRPPKYR